MLEDLLASADTFFKEQPQQSGKDLLFRLEEYHGLNLKTSTSDLDNLSSNDLVEVLPQTAVEIVELASAAAARDALGGDSAVPGSRLSREEMAAADDLLEKRHRCRLDSKAQQ